MIEYAAPTVPGPAATPRRRRWWPFGLLGLALVLGICAISVSATRHRPTAPAQAAAPVKAADVAAPLPAKPCRGGICATPPADNPPASAAGPAAVANGVTPPPADNPPASAAGPAARATGSTFAVDGVVELEPGQFTPVGTSCAGSAAFSDVGLGTAVTVTDAAGVVVAADELDLALTTRAGLSIGPPDETCDLQFTVAGIPAGRGYYGVEVAHRGSVKFPEASLRSGLLNLVVA